MFRRLGLTILRKGAVDIICDGEMFILLCEPASPRRCGGQGDVMAGMVGLWMGWSKAYYDGAKRSQKSSFPPLGIISAYAGSYLVRNFAVSAFEKMKRSTLTTDIIKSIPEVLEKEFPVESKL